MVLMTRVVYFFLICLTSFMANGQKGQDYITIKLNRASGNGPFFQGYSNLARASSVKGNEKPGAIPIAYSHVPLTKGILITDYNQMVWSAVKNGRMDSVNFPNKWFSGLAKGELNRLTDQMVDTEVSIAHGELDGRYILIIDTDNDESFEDEIVRTVPGPNKNGNFPNTVEIYSAEVERFIEGKVIVDSVHFVFNPYSDIMVGVSTSEYRFAELTIDNEVKYLYLNNQGQGIHYAQSNLRLIVSDYPFNSNEPDVFRSEFYPKMLRANEFLETARNRYQIAGVNSMGTELYLNRVDKEAALIGTQVGAAAPMISGVTLNNEPYELEEGNLTLLDFWGTWCAPCIDELPYLYDAYEFFSGDGFEIVAIAYDKKERVEEFVEARNLKWTQLMENEVGNVIKDYKVTGYPRGFLLNTKNEIIQKGIFLRSSNLVNTVKNELGISNDEFHRRIKSGNVVLSLPDLNFVKVEIRGGFTNKIAKPLYNKYNESNNWERGFNLSKGRYSLQVKYTIRNRPAPKLFYQEIEVTGDPGQIIVLKDK